MKKVFILNVLRIFLEEVDVRNRKKSANPHYCFWQKL